MKRDLILLGIIIAVGVLTFDLFFYPGTLEDAFITFRYSDHLAQGHGFGAWNISGEKVEGYTSFLWMLLLAAAGPLGIGTAALAKILGIVSHLLLCLILIVGAALMEKRERADPSIWQGHKFTFIFASLLMAFYLPVAYYAVSGMETIPFALLVLLCFAVPYGKKSTLLTGLVFAATVLMRPEGILIVLTCGIYHFVRRWKLGWDLRPAVAGIGAGLAALGFLTLFRLFVYGDWLPNTYYAKAAGAGWMHWDIGRGYLRHWYKTHPTWSIVFVLTALVSFWRFFKKGNREYYTMVFLPSLWLLYAVYIIKVGGDNPWAFPTWRHLLHVIPLLAIFLGAGIVVLIPKARTLRWLALLIMLGSANYQMLHSKYTPFFQEEFQNRSLDFPSLTQAPHNPYYLWLKDLTDSSTVIASSLGGELPYVVDAVHIDMLGLNDYTIAHYGTFDPGGMVDSKTDIPYVISRKPDIIEGYVSARKILDGLPRDQIVRYRRKMVSELLDDPTFQRDYLFLKSGPYQFLDRALFLRRDFWEQHPQRAQLDCLPVAATSLYH